MAEVSWSEEAIRQWKKIIETVAETSAGRAQRLASQLMRAPDHLAHSPKMGRRVPELGRDDIRELVSVRPFRIIYQLQGDVCVVLAVIHGRRDLRMALREQGLEDL